MARRKGLQIILSALLGINATLVEARADVILDTLGSATTTTTFSVFGSGGQVISATQKVGSAFSLTQPTLITEIGGFVNNCETIVSGIPQCPNRLPFLIEIVRAGESVPLAQFALPLDTDPLTVDYEAVDINLPLNAGTYFALFAAQDQNAGFLLSDSFAVVPPYRPVPDTILLGFETDEAGVTLSEGAAAVRIIGVAIPEPDSLLLAFSASALFAAIRRTAKRH
jgi:hypothetical protein